MKLVKSKPVSHAYVTLKSAEDREIALQVLSGCKLKGRSLVVRESAPLPDPLIRLHKDNRQCSKVNLDENFDTLPPEEQADRINSQVASFWKLSYDEQMKAKCSSLGKVLQKCSNNYSKLFSAKSEMNTRVFEFFKTIELEARLIRSPVVDGYRNKCEFNIGPDLTIGFRLGEFERLDSC